MNAKISRLLDYLLTRSDQKFFLKISQMVMNRGIPFNIHHKFKFIELTDTQSTLKMPYIRNNKNHLGGAHACAIATLGEYSAGLLLTKSLGSGKYRIILKDLQVHYKKQGRTELIGKAFLSEKEKNELMKEADEKGVIEKLLTTKIYDHDEQLVSEVKTLWQFKNWTQTRFKK